MKRIMNVLRGAREERGITGLETAIVLIAFMVVAAVFAFVVLTPVSMSHTVINLK